MNLLFVSSTYVGDAVLSTGLLRELLRRHPGARVTVACGKAALPVFAAAPGVVRLIGIVKRGKLGHWIDLWRDCVGTVWDVAVDLRGSALLYLLRAKERHVYRPDPSRAYRLQALAATVGLVDMPQPVAWTSAADAAEAASLLPPGLPAITLGTTGNWRAKTWRPERFAELALRLTAEGGPLAGGRLVVLGAPGEEAETRPLIERLPAERTINLVGRTTLAVSAAVLKRAALHIGIDSSPVYMAAAADIPTLVLRGPTPGLFGPRRGDLIAPWAPKAAEVTTTETWQELTSPSKAERDAMTSRMDSLTVDAAEAGAVQLLKRLGEPT